MRSGLALITIVFLSLFASQLYSGQTAPDKERALQYLKDRGEVYFKFYVNALSEIDKLTNIVSIDKVEQGDVYAYANPKEFEVFLNQGLYYEVLTPPGLETQCEMYERKNGDIRPDWTKYPTYSTYVTIMQGLEASYPNFVKLYEIGTTMGNRKMFFAKVSDNVAVKEREPEFIATSTIHGDETFGWVAMMRMIEYLCMNYQSDATAKKIVDNIELWICPNVNPDGTYKSGDNTVTGAVRANNNGVDLNRNHPDPQRGWNVSMEKETKNLVEFSLKHNFIMGIDIHGGMESIVYPYAYAVKTPPDNSWWVMVCSEYVKETRKVNANYLSSPLTVGYGSAGRDYYTALGTRIDFPYWHTHCRGTCPELNSQKLLSESNLEKYWSYNKQALINYFTEVLYGVQGIVTDSLLGRSLDNVKVFVKNLDADSSYTRSDTNGTYYRPIIAGTYSFEFSHPDCVTKTVSSVVVENKKATILDVKLKCGDCIETLQNVVSKDITITPYGKGFTIRYHTTKHTGFFIFDIRGKLLRTLTGEPVNKQGIVWDGKDYRGHYISKGCYIIKIRNNEEVLTTNFIINR